MRFYEGQTLQNTENKYSFFTKKRLIFPESILKKIPALGQANTSIQIIYFKDEHSATVYLHSGNYYIATCTLSTVEFNCSAIMVANLYTAHYYNKGLGWFLLDLIEQWAVYAGYTLLIGNTAGTEQNMLIPKFKEKGWIESNINYVNARTRNRNIWLYKVIADVEGGNDDEDDDEYYEVDYSDEDEEF